jgi:hypothetical protein
MSGIEFATAAIAATLGGPVGAAGTALLSWSQVQSSFNDLRQAIEELGNGEETAKVRRAAQALWRDLGILMAALAKLKELLRIR